MDYQKINTDVEEHVVKLFNELQPPQLVYHNLLHTRNVVLRSKEIAQHFELSDREMLIITLASWFHDTGYLFVKPSEHEEKSVLLMREFAEKYQLPEDITAEVASCIMATRMPQKPQNLLEEILCDADTYHFGTKDFKFNNKLAGEEMRLQQLQNFSRSAFDESTISMLKGHRFFTSYTKDLLNTSKKKNIKKLKKEKHKKNHVDDIITNSISEKDGTTKGMQTMLRLTSGNHIKLSDMADRKANILISVNAIIISVILSQLIRRLQTDPYLTIPTIIFLVSAVSTIVVAILATRPKVNSGKFADLDVANKKTNLLFFGNFHKMPAENYEAAMRTLMRDSDYLYGSIIKDIYYLGVVLGKKYRLIRVAYNIFMVGIIISVIAFAVASFFGSAPPTAAIPNKGGSPF
ncbi:MAG: Pycsar system effector family protein [Ferruginibacter sp.]